jgi:hypothetical protein
MRSFLSWPGRRLSLSERRSRCASTYTRGEGDAVRWRVEGKAEVEGVEGEQQVAEGEADRVRSESSAPDRG